ncbi:MAG: hypothetical protein AAGG11_19990 [Pseudomonadota bacterium]
MARKGRYSRWYVTGRTIAAVLLGYLFASTSGLVIALVMPADRITGVLTGTIATFLLWGAAIMWAFAVEQTRTVLLGLGCAIGLTGALAWALYSTQVQL